MGVCGSEHRNVLTLDTWMWLRGVVPTLCVDLEGCGLRCRGGGGGGGGGVGYVNTRITPRLADVTIAETPPRSARKSKIKSSSKKIF
jgi:hypothetical protein